MSLIDLSRWQFAIAVMFNMTFPAITVGLSIFLSILYGGHWRTGNTIYLQMFRFWRRIFAVGFGCDEARDRAPPANCRARRHCVTTSGRPRR